jgi:hypothetical protein
MVVAPGTAHQSCALYKHDELSQQKSLFSFLVTFLQCCRRYCVPSSEGCGGHNRYLILLGCVTVNGNIEYAYGVL